MVSSFYNFFFFLSSAFSSAHGAAAVLPGDIKMENYIDVQEALDLWKAQFSEEKEQELPEDVSTNIVGSTSF